jgi:hypothetical protein
MRGNELETNIQETRLYVALLAGGRPPLQKPEIKTHAQSQEI